MKQRRNVILCCRIVIILTIIFVIVFANNSVKDLRNQKQEIAQLDEEIEDLESNNANLEYYIGLYNDPETRKQLARQKFGWISENDIVLSSNN